MSYYNRDNGSNNEVKRPSVVTRSGKGYNSDQKVPVALEWSFTDDMMRLVFAPQLPESQRTEMRIYDYDKAWTTCLTRIKALELLRGVESRILPCLKSNEPLPSEIINVSVPVANVNSIGIGLFTDDSGAKSTYLQFCKDIDGTSHVADRSIRYCFKKGQLIINHDQSTGAFDDMIITNIEFYMFLRDMSAFITEGSNAGVHAYRYVEKFFKDVISGNIISIAKAVNAPYSEPKFGTGDRSRTESTALWSKDATKTSEDQIKSLDEINSEFNIDDVPF